MKEPERIYVGSDNWRMNGLHIEWVISPFPVWKREVAQQGKKLKNI